MLLLQLFISIALAAPSEIPSRHAFLGWSDQTDHDAIRFSKVKKTELKCANKKLFPAYPQSYLKQYHEVLIGSYDHAKMTIKDEACAIAGYGPRKHCLRPKLLHSYVISDTFIDTCGNYYRGFWSVVFFDKDESMGSLLSKGRTVYEDHRSPFPGTFVYGEPYEVDLSEFLFLAEPFAGDVEKSRAFNKTP